MSAEGASTCRRAIRLHAFCVSRIVSLELCLSNCVSRIVSLGLYLSNCISRIVSLELYLSNCVSRIVSLKLYLSNCVQRAAAKPLSLFRQHPEDVPGPHVGVLGHQQHQQIRPLRNIATY